MKFGFVDVMLVIFAALWVLAAVQFLRVKSRTAAASGILDRLGVSAHDYAQALRLQTGIGLVYVTILIATYAVLRMLGYNSSLSVTHAGGNLIPPAALVLFCLVLSWGPVRRRTEVISRVDKERAGGRRSFWGFVFTGVGGVGAMAFIAMVLHNNHIDSQQPTLFWVSLTGGATMLVGFIWLSMRSSPKVN